MLQNLTYKFPLSGFNSKDLENGEIGMRVEDSHPGIQNKMEQSMESSPISLIQQPSFQLLLNQRATSGEGRPYKKRKKRKRSLTTKLKNVEDAEKQRITHIAVERNNRRLMTHHLKSLISMVPPSYVQKEDQASIIGGAIDFVKELEQVLQSLQAQKRMRQSEDANLVRSCCSSSSSSSSSFQFRHSHGKLSAEIEVVIAEKHVNLKVQCQRKAGQLLKAIVELEALRFSVLHLNITSLSTFVLFSFNLKIEDDCKLRTAEEVANAVHQIFTSSMSPKLDQR